MAFKEFNKKKIVYSMYVLHMLLVRRLFDLIHLPYVRTHIPREDKIQATYTNSITEQLETLAKKLG